MQVHHWTTNQNTTDEVNTFVVQVVSSAWLDYHMESIEQGRPIEFIRHRRESGGYHKVTENNGHWGPSSSIQRVDNRTELE